MVWTHHHLLLDGWSLSIVLKELFVFYEAACQGKDVLLPSAHRYRDYIAWLGQQDLGRAEAFWREALRGFHAPTPLPVGRSGGEDRPSAGPAEQERRLPSSTTGALERFSRAHGLTLSTVLQGAWGLLLSRTSGEDDVVFGATQSGRSVGLPGVEAMVGLLINTLPVRVRVPSDHLVVPWLAQLQAQQAEQLPYAYSPLVEVQGFSEVPRGQALFESLLVVENYPVDEQLRQGNTPLAITELRAVEQTNYPLTVTVVPGREMVLRISYAEDRFDATGIAQMVEDFQVLLERFAAADPGQLISAAAAGITRRTFDLAVIATFTAEPIEDTLALWMDELKMPGRIKFAPYGQVFQQLLDPTSLFARNLGGANIVLVRFEDWLNGGSARRETEGRDDLEKLVDDLTLALKGASQRCPVPHVVVLCPPSPAVLGRPDLVERLRRLESSLRSALASLSGTQLITGAEIDALYPVSEIHDPHSDELGHIPYTPVYFSALGTAVMRRLSGVLSAPYKVIVLDCDETLWRGIVGEVGPGGIVVDPPRRSLQEFMVEQHEKGMLLCLASKNNEADVLEAFEQHGEMPLRRDHLLAHRINWRPKSENLISLAEELQLSLDSFVFVDDDPLECAEVKARCPEVLTVELPREPDRILDVLRHVWAFDHLTTSKEDRQRTALYRQNVQRERLRNEVPTLQEFVASLELHVSLVAMAPEHLGRVSQLTQRTNQLNFTTIRRVESDIEQRLSSGELEGLVTEVRDRFGDYGLVGCVLFSVAKDALCVDTFLLSCRALGRGVEVRMLARLGEIAMQRRLRRIEITYRRTEKNKPALEFLEKLGEAFQKRSSEGYVFDCPTEYVEALDPAAYLSRSRDAIPSAPVLAVEPKKSRRAFVVPDHVHTSLDHAEKVLAKARPWRRKHAARLANSDAFLAPRDAVELELVRIWEELLGVKPVGVREDFLSLGGHSLLAVRMMARIQEQFGQGLPLSTLFQAPTVEALAQRLRGQASPRPWSPLVPIQPAGRGRPFFCVHPAAGTVWCYADLARHMGQDRPFYGLQSRGFEGEPDAGIEEMAARYIEALRAVQPEGPYLLGGWSSGGLVAFEMAQQLSSSGARADRVDLVAILDTGASLGSGPVVDDALLLVLLARFHGVQIEYDDLRPLGPDEQIRHFLDVLLSADAVPPGIALDHTRRQLEVYKTMFEVGNRYVPCLYPGRITAFWASETMRSPTGEPEMRANETPRVDLSAFSSQPVTIHEVPGDHFTMLRAPHVQILADRLRRCLLEVDP